jgi:hypothetical protein
MQTIAIVLLALFSFFLLAWLAFLEFRYRKMAANYRAMMRGREGAELEAVLQDYLGRVNRVDQSFQLYETRLTNLEAARPYQVQHVGMVRFNPFGDKGSDQSFAIAVLDDHTDGFVLSCLHARADLKVYAKPIRGGQSTYTLLPEEKDAIARAMKPHA